MAIIKEHYGRKNANLRSWADPFPLIWDWQHSQPIEINSHAPVVRHYSIILSCCREPDLKKFFTRIPPPSWRHSGDIPPNHLFLEQDWSRSCWVWPCVWAHCTCCRVNCQSREKPKISTRMKWRTREAGPSHWRSIEGKYVTQSHRVDSNVLF